jgi:HEPN domain-containing protein
MKPSENELRTLVRAWVRKADQDLTAAESLLRNEEGLPEIVAFHAQQSAEKYLKALLAWRQVEFPKTHDIRELLELARPSDSSIADSLADAARLTPFGVETRYPADAPALLPGEEKQALDIARRVKEAVAKVVRT